MDRSELKNSADVIYPRFVVSLSPATIEYRESRNQNPPTPQYYILHPRHDQHRTTMADRLTQLQDAIDQVDKK